MDTPPDYRPKPLHRDGSLLTVVAAAGGSYAETGSVIPGVALIAVWIAGHFGVRINAQIQTARSLPDGVRLDTPVNVSADGVTSIVDEGEIVADVSAMTSEDFDAIPDDATDDEDGPA